MMVLERTIRFDAKASRPKHGLALIFDLEGFSNFFNQPDVQDYVPQFINKVSAALSIVMFGGPAYWAEPEVEYKPLALKPIHEKFLGDGAMYLWLNSTSTTITSAFVTELCNRLWLLKSGFGHIVHAAYEQMPVVDLPRKIRFGVARGTIYELQRKGGRQREYIGFCINLASRLQKYCPDLGFIASARVRIPEHALARHHYLRVVAKHIKGFPREIVIVDAEEYSNLSDDVRADYFEDLEAPG
jgi:class 3 adenylate cyclase